MSLHPVRWVAAGAVVALGLSACSVSGLALKAGTDFEILSPKVSSTVDQLPLQVSWKAPADNKLIAPGSAGPGVYYGVFVDRQPLRPGQGLLALVDVVCKRTPGCANQTYFANKNVFLTAEPRLVVDSLTKHKLHRITVVLLDQNNTRVGEVAATTSFRVRGDR